MNESRVKINTLQDLRRRKTQVRSQLYSSEMQIKNNLYLYTHPVSWAANALTERNMPATGNALLRLAAVSSRFFRIGQMAYRMYRLFRK